MHIISVEENWQRGLRLGAIDFLIKPATKESLSEALTTLHEFVDRPVKRLLVVEDDEAPRQSIVELIGNGDVQTTTVGTGEEALAALQREHFDCMVLDLGLPDMTGFQLITRVKSEIGLRKLPTIVYTGKQLTRREEAELRRLAESVVIKDAGSPERLLDETALFLHRVTAKLPDGKRRMLEQLHRTDPTLTGRKVLIVDDDVRNIFALTTFLERSEMKVVYAESGRDGIAPAAGDARHRRGADGRHDAGDGRLRDDARHPGARPLPPAPDHRRHRQGDEGRPGEVHRGRRVGLHRQAGGHGSAAVAAARMAVPVTAGRADGRSAVGGRRRRRMAPGRPARPPVRLPPAAVAGRPPTPTDRVNILLVDDQPANLLALEAMLQGLGQNLVKAESGREALKWLLTHEFAVILLDVKMPDMDGFETAALIRQRDKSRDTPIIFLTAADKTQTQAVRGYAVGAVDYLVKPVVPEFVRSKVAVFVELAKKTELLRRQAELLRESEQAARELAEARAELVRGPGAQEPGAGELQLRRLPRSPGAAPADRGFSRAVLESQGERLDDDGRRFLDRIREASRQMSQLIDDVLYLSKVTRAELRQQEVDLSAPGRPRSSSGCGRAEPDAAGRDRVRPASW